MYLLKLGSDVQLMKHVRWIDTCNIDSNFDNYK